MLTLLNNLKFLVGPIVTLLGVLQKVLLAIYLINKGKEKVYLEQSNEVIKDVKETNKAANNISALSDSALDSGLRGTKDSTS
jgi:hypothetical protein